MDRIVDECRKCDGQLICRESITPGHTACELFRKKRAQNTVEISETDNQHTQPKICAYLKANDMCCKWLGVTGKYCSFCEASRKLQASA